MNKHKSTAIWPAWRDLAAVVVLSAAAATTAGCAFGGSDGGGPDEWSNVEPDDQGIYSFNGDDLVRLDGDPEWEQKTWGKRSNLAPRNEFVIRDESLAELSGSAAGVVGIRKVAWVRSNVTEDGRITPVTSSQWQSTPLSALEVPLDYAERPESDPDLLRLRPQRPLEPGLYAIYVGAGQKARTARFGVAWPKTDKQAYAASVCVDRYVGETAALRPCQDQASADSEDSLQIYLVDPQVRTSGAGQSIVISGVILNQSSRTRHVPLLAAELRDASGRALKRWRFKAASVQIEPGQATSFRTEIDDTSQYAHSVNVNFASTQASN